ncbi:hypothetical protein GCM10027199_71600 [Amycolatopsis magusensis]
MAYPDTGGLPDLPPIGWCPNRGFRTPSTHGSRRAGKSVSTDHPKERAVTRERKNEDEDKEKEVIRGEQGTSDDPHDDTDPQSGE